MSLKPGLESYIQSLFGDDIYQATPFFRGIYFSSACRKGQPGSDFLETTGITYNNEGSMDQNKGFFLKSFFSAILPKDRNIFSPLTEIMQIFFCKIADSNSFLSNTFVNLFFLNPQIL
jgi:type VI secretion system protein ImpL